MGSFFQLANIKPNRNACVKEHSFARKNEAQCFAASLRVALFNFVISILNRPRWKYFFWWVHCTSLSSFTNEASRFKENRKKDGDCIVLITRTRKHNIAIVLNIPGKLVYFGWEKTDKLDNSIELLVYGPSI